MRTDQRERDVVSGGMELSRSVFFSFCRARDHVGLLVRNSLTGSRDGKDELSDMHNGNPQAATKPCGPPEYAALCAHSLHCDLLGGSRKALALGIASAIRGRRRTITPAISRLELCPKRSMNMGSAASARGAAP
jgi:hypothetical protein